MILGHLTHLPLSTEATNKEVLELIEQRKLYGKGVGISDVAILASTLLTQGAVLFTKDKRLDSIARELGVAY